MATKVKKLDLKIGDVVEIEGRRYDVIPDKNGGMALEPAITMSVAEMHAKHGERPLSRQEAREWLGDLPSDGEG